MQEIKLGVLHRKRRRKREEGMAKKRGGGERAVFKSGWEMLRCTEFSKFFM